MEHTIFIYGKASNLDDTKECVFETVEDLINFLKVQKEIDSNIKGFDFDLDHNTIVAIDSNITFAEYNVALNE